MKRIQTVIIGAGQAGLAMSRCLAERSVDHVVIERGQVANSWRTERWDSLRLLTPNWQSRLPGYRYDGDDPDGYMTMPEVVRYLDGYASASAAPIETRTRVSSVKAAGGGYSVSTDHGEWQCDALVIASGACNMAAVPALAQNIPKSVESWTPMRYRNPDQLRDGTVLVVGASATGVQLAAEIQASGRRVIIAAGEHVRVPRTYRGRDIKWWMEVTGILDVDLGTVDDVLRARRVPSLQLVGTPERATIDLNTLRASGVEIVGRLSGIRDGQAQFSGSLANQCALADLKMSRLLDTIDDWIATNGKGHAFDAPYRPEPTATDTQPRLGVDLTDGNIETVLWATGYRPDYSWLHVPVFDRKGRLRHQGGIVDAPGLYVLGLPFLRRRKSSLIDGVGADAIDLADHLCARLFRAAA